MQHIDKHRTALVNRLHNDKTIVDKINLMRCSFFILLLMIFFNRLLHRHVSNCLAMKKLVYLSCQSVAGSPSSRGSMIEYFKLQVFKVQ